MTIIEPHQLGDVSGGAAAGTVAGEAIKIGPLKLRPVGPKVPGWFAASVWGIRVLGGLVSGVGVAFAVHRTEQSLPKPDALPRGEQTTRR